MKRYFLFSSSLLFLGFAFRAPKSELTEVENFGTNTGNLKMYKYDPFTQKDNIKRPLVVVLHGCSQTANDASELTGWNKIAKAYKFYVLYPQQKRINNGSNCF